VKVRRRAVLLSLGAAFAALSLFASLGAAGPMGRLTADIWPNTAPGDGIVPGDGVLPTDAPPLPGDPSTTCAAPGDGTNDAPSLPGDPSTATGADPAPGDPSATCSSDGSLRGDIWPNDPLRGDIWPNGPSPSDTLPDGIAPDGTYGGVPLF
jgi:hypothetical protein